MRIGIDARPLSRQRTGIGNYVKGLVELLPRLAPEHSYFLYSNRSIDLPIAEAAVQRRVDHAWGWCPGSFWLLGRGARLARPDALDIYWATNAVLPPRLPPAVLKVVTVYDMVWLRCPETTSRYNLLVQTLCAKEAITKADIIVVISLSTGDELKERMGVSDHKIRLIYPGISPIYRPLDPSGAAAYISEKYSVPIRYMATVGSVEPRKNLKVLVDALTILKRNGQLDCPLLVAGASGWRNSELFQQIRLAGLSDNEIKFMGYLPDADLPQFYAGAQVFLFPTLYEGFGLPPVEAMACGTPVIASDSQCMPEVLDDAAILLPPTAADSFATAIVRVLGDQLLRRDLRGKGIQRAQNFRFDKSVRQLLDIFEDRVQPTMTTEHSDATV